ncbi:hypothetical protein TRIP_D310216 [uncultured Paludibacter sp.]|nr:hypothetical protein TRIP_D310216 [uncultured Paludibacter sp.]
MDKEQNKFMTDLNRLLESQDFQSEEELKAFMNNLMGQKIPTFSNNGLNKRLNAQDLVYEAYDLSPAKAKKKIEQALELDPECIGAYEYLGSSENSIELASIFFEKGISIGRELFLGKNYKNYKGHFWGILETRPFMRCLHSYSEILYLKNKKNESIKILEEMISLNPNDNQGVRDFLLLYLVELNENEKFEKYYKMYEEDDIAFSLFNFALYTFKNEGNTTNSKNQLQNAIQKNKFIISKLIAGKTISKQQEYYSLGDESEADYYVNYALQVWQQTKGAISWLKQNAK